LQRQKEYWRNFVKRFLYRVFVLLIFILFIYVYLTFKIEMSSSSQIQILLNIRLPRLILAILTGAGLSLSGAVMQTLFRNPLADSYMLGISGGALFGVMLSKFIFGGNLIINVILSFVFSVLSFFLSLILSKSIKGDKRFTLVLSGLMLNIIFSSVVIVMSMLMRADAKDMFYMLMGSLNIIILKRFIFFYIILALLLIFSFLFFFIKSKELDLLAFGDEIAISSGLEAKKSFYTMMLFSVLIVSILVSFSGIIGFIGVLIPNMVRISKQKHIKLLPESIFYGAFALTLSDFIAKNSMAFEMPVGVVTSIVGVPFLFIILSRSFNAKS